MDPKMFMLESASAEDDSLLQTVFFPSPNKAEVESHPLNAWTQRTIFVLVTPRLSHTSRTDTSVMRRHARWLTLDWKYTSWRSDETRRMARVVISKSLWKGRCLCLFYSGCLISVTKYSKWCCQHSPHLLPFPPGAFRLAGQSVHGLAQRFSNLWPLLALEEPTIWLFRFKSVSIFSCAIYTRTQNRDHYVNILSELRLINCCKPDLHAVKVKRTILHLECWWGAHLPSYGREPIGG